MSLSPILEVDRPWHICHYQPSNRHIWPARMLMTTQHSLLEMQGALKVRIRKATEINEITGYCRGSCSIQQSESIKQKIPKSESTNWSKHIIHKKTGWFKSKWLPKEFLLMFTSQNFYGSRFIGFISPRVGDLCGFCSWIWRRYELGAAGQGALVILVLENSKWGPWVLPFLPGDFWFF